VDWAIDPVAGFEPPIVVLPRSGTRASANIRSPAGFHDRIVLEVSIASTVIAVDEPLTGSIALRGGGDARFDAVVLSMVGVTTVTMGRGDSRSGAAMAARIPKAALVNGTAVPFVFRPSATMLPTFRTGYLEHDTVLEVTVDIPWASDPSF